MLFQTTGWTVGIKTNLLEKEIEAINLLDSTNNVENLLIGKTDSGQYILKPGIVP
jgi:hypothetical protein